MRKRMDIEMLLRHLGLNATFDKGKWTAKCPSPDHPDNKPSWSIIDNIHSRQHGSHFCMACNFGGGPWELIAAVRGISIREAGDIAASMLVSSGPAKAPTVVIPTPRFRDFKLPPGTIIPERAADFYGPAREYLNKRGVTDEQIEKYGIGYSIRGRLRLRVVIPVYTAGKLRTFSARAFAENMMRYDAGKEVDGAEASEAVFGEPQFDGGDTVTIAEGCFSMLALDRAGAPNPCAILSSYLTPGRILDLSRFKRIIVATDPDAAGDKVMKAISPLSRRAEIVRLRLDNSPDDVPDFELTNAVSHFLLTTGITNRITKV